MFRLGRPLCSRRLLLTLRREYLLDDMQELPGGDQKKLLFPKPNVKED